MSYECSCDVMYANRLPLFDIQTANQAARAWLRHSGNGDVLLRPSHSSDEARAQPSLAQLAAARRRQRLDRNPVLYAPDLGQVEWGHGHTAVAYCFASLVPDVSGKEKIVTRLPLLDHCQLLCLDCRTADSRSLSWLQLTILGFFFSYCSLIWPYHWLSYIQGLGRCTLFFMCDRPSDVIITLNQQLCISYFAMCVYCIL